MAGPARTRESLTIVHPGRPDGMQPTLASRFFLVALAVGTACLAYAEPAVVLVGGPCQGCEAVFEGRPARLAVRARIAPEAEPGEPLIIEGVVADADGAPVAGVIVYAYHTDASGLYPRQDNPQTAAEKHGRLRGFVRTGADGSYRFDTIRPGSYPDTDIPQHVHMHVVETRCHYTIDDIQFTDDPRLTAAVREAHGTARGGRGIVTPTRQDGTWRVRRDIVLGAGIEAYARCGRR
jgi:protocatechuate 3,4-dioxygenase beta subunit